MSLINQSFSREKSEAQTGDYAQTVYRLSFVTALVSLAMLLSNLSVAIEASNFILILGQSATLVISLFAILLSRRGKPAFSVWLMLFGISSAFPFAVLNTQGIGLFLGSVTLIWGAFISAIGLRGRQISWGLIFTNGLGITTWLLDLFGSPDRTRADLPPLMVAGMLVGILVVYLLSFPHLIPSLSLQVKLAVGFAVAALFAAIGVGVMTAQNLQESMTEQIGRNFSTSTENLAELVDSFLAGKISQVVALADSDILKEQVEARNASYSGSEANILAEIQSLDSQWLTASDYDPLIRNIITPNPEINPSTYQMKDYLEVFPDQTELILTDRYGATVAATGHLSDYYQADQEWWQVAWNNGDGAIYISDPESDESTGMNAVLIAVPVYKKGTNEIGGIVRSTLAIEDLGEIIISAAFGETGHAALIGRTGYIIYESSDVENSISLAPAILMHILQQRFSSGEAEHFIIGLDANGNEAFFGHAPISHSVGEEANTTNRAIEDAIARLDWTAVIRQEAYEAFAPIEQVTRMIQIVAAIMLVLVAVAAFFLSTGISRPVQALSKTAKSISAGDLDAPLPKATTQDEIGDLTVSFAEMTTRLRRNLIDLDRRARQVGTSAEVSRRLSTVLDPDRLVIEVVEELQNAFGYYHAHIYLVDENSRELVMVGGTGAAGRELLAAGHKIQWGHGLTGRAAESNASVLVPDTSQEMAWLPNPLLPDTKAEIAVPIAVGNHVMGVLDVQHDEVGGLDIEDQALLESIARQVAVALQNTRLFVEVEQSAEHEALVNLIAERIQSATTIEDTLQIAARELGKALRVKRAGVQLSHPGDDSSSLN
jgi:putative methionine-R-sulfoxide reductase with GAF domain/HAMP domain-containing protein